MGKPPEGSLTVNVVLWFALLLPPPLLSPCGLHERSPLLPLPPINKAVSVDVPVRLELVQCCGPIVSERTTLYRAKGVAAAAPMVGANGVVLPSSASAVVDARSCGGCSVAPGKVGAVVITSAALVVVEVQPPGEPSALFPSPERHAVTSLKTLPDMPPQTPYEVLLPVGKAPLSLLLTLGASLRTLKRAVAARPAR